MELTSKGFRKPKKNHVNKFEHAQNAASLNALRYLTNVPYTLIHIIVLSILMQEICILEVGILVVGTFRIGDLLVHIYDVDTLVVLGILDVDIPVNTWCTLDDIG